MGMHPALVAAHLQMSPCACCNAPTPAPLLGTLRDRQVHSLPLQCLGNGYERRILLEHLQQRGLSASQLLTDCLGRVAAGAFVARCERAALGPAGRVVAPDARICPACSDATFGVLCYQYRVAIPADQLPAAVTQRPNCWYGKECRTQRSNPMHAERLNHICENTGGGGKGGGGKGGGGKGGGGGRGSGAGKGKGAAAGGPGGGRGGGAVDAAAAVGGPAGQDAAAADAVAP